MASTFKVGDKVKFVGKLTERENPPDPNKVYTVRETPSIFDGVYLEEHNSYFWYGAENFERAKPDPQTVPGVPYGYRLVRIGTPKAGESYLNSYNKACKADHDFVAGGYPVVERTTKTERLWIVVDLHDGTTSKEWVADGANYLTSSRRYNAIETQQTREVPA